MQDFGGGAAAAAWAATVGGLPPLRWFGGCRAMRGPPARGPGLLRRGMGGRLRRLLARRELDFSGRRVPERWTAAAAVLRSGPCRRELKHPEGNQPGGRAGGCDAALCNRLWRAAAVRGSLDLTDYPLAPPSPPSPLPLLLPSPCTRAGWVAGRLECLRCEAVSRATAAAFAAVTARF